MTNLKKRTQTSYFHMTDEILDAPTTAKEIHDQISKLKNKKAFGTDTILNEMIKHGRIISCLL